MSTVASVADKTGFYLLVICAILAPIPNGSNTASAAGVIGLVLSLGLLGSPLVSRLNQKATRLLNVCLVLSGFLVLWSVIQTLPWSASSPLPQPSLDGTQPVSPPQDLLFFAHLQPLHSIGYVLIPFAGFMLSIIYIRDDARYMTFLHSVLGAGFVVTALCIGEYALSRQTLLLQPKHYYLSSFTGTFVNPNTAATYFGVMLLSSLSLCLNQFSQTQFPRHNGRAPLIHPQIRIFLVYCIWTFVFALALLLTRSRAGILSSLIAVVGLIWAHTYAALRSRDLGIRAAIVSTLCAAAAVALFTLFADGVAQRLEIEGLVDPGRLCTYRSTWHAIKDHFWLGTGLGSFQDVFPMYRLPECGLNGYWEMAHSVFLEAWLSLGVGFFILLTIIYYQLIKSYVHGVLNRQRFRFVSLASLSILLLVTLHSMVDFSLQIPGVAAVVGIFLGAGAAQSLAPAASRAARRRRAEVAD
jgi:O-antigen ligase